MVNKALLSALLRQLPRYEIDESTVPIYFVWNEKSWTHCQDRLLQARFMGLDTETRPVFSKGQKANPCALLQIAVHYSNQQEEVFILDLLQLAPGLYNSTLSTVFQSQEILKLGQGFYHDLLELTQSYPTASCFSMLKNFVEVNDLSAFVSGGHLPLSLQKLVFLYLDRNLTKSQQTSNWEFRPLSPRQMHYAAADALVLIHLLLQLLNRSEKGLSKDFILQGVTTTIDATQPPPLRCHLCFQHFSLPTDLKRHRDICPTQQLHLQICSICNAKALLPANVMQLHVEQCTTTTST